MWSRVHYGVVQITFLKVEAADAQGKRVISSLQEPKNSLNEQVIAAFFQ